MVKMSPGEEVSRRYRWLSPGEKVSWNSKWHLGALIVFVAQPVSEVTEASSLTLLVYCLGGLPLRGSAEGWLVEDAGGNVYLPTSFSFLHIPSCLVLCAKVSVFSWLCLWSKRTHVLSWVLTWPSIPLLRAQMNDQSFLLQNIWVSGTKQLLKTKMFHENESCEKCVKQCIVEHIM